MGVEELDSRVVPQFLEFIFRYTSDILEEAQVCSTNLLPELAPPRDGVVTSFSAEAAMCLPTCVGLCRARGTC